MRRLVGPVSNGQSASSLKPEKARSFSVGLVLEPVRDVSMSLDYWQIKVKNLIGGLPEQEIFASSTKYASRFVRCSQLIAGQVPGITADMIDACANINPATGLDPIAFIDQPTENLGEMEVNGIDLSASWRLPSTSYGNFGIGLDGTYITKYRYQRERGGAFINAAGRYSDNAPVFRWQHVLSLNWAMCPWSAILAQRFKSSYKDQGGESTVGSYLLHDVSVTYTGVKNLTVTAGIGNLFDRQPPRSVQVTTFQRGFDPRFTDPLGRTFMLKGSYRF